MNTLTEQKRQLQEQIKYYRQQLTEARRQASRFTYRQGWLEQQERHFGDAITDTALHIEAIDRLLSGHKTYTKPAMAPVYKCGECGGFFGEEQMIADVCESCGFWIATGVL